MDLIIKSFLIPCFILFLITGCKEKPGPINQEINPLAICGNKPEGSKANPSQSKNLQDNKNNKPRKKKEVEGQYYCNQYIVTFKESTPSSVIQKVEKVFTDLGDRKIKTCMCGDWMQLWEFNEDGIELQERDEPAHSTLGVDSIFIDEINYNYLVFFEPDPRDRQKENDQKSSNRIPPSPDAKRDSIKVAIIDSGIKYDHPDLKKSIWENLDEDGFTTDKDSNCLVDDIQGWDFLNEDNDPMDIDGHGTHVAGIVSNGFLTDIQLQMMNLKIAERDTGSLFDGICAIHYAIDKKARVINLSWGYQGDFSNPLLKALQRADSNNIVVVTSSGNEYADNDIVPHWPSNFRMKNLIAVAALEESGLNIADYSNNGANRVHISASGTNIESTFLGDTRQYLSGTSMAAAFVTKTAAEIRAKFPRLDDSEVVDCILNSADTGTFSRPIQSNRLLNHTKAVDCSKVMAEAKIKM